MKLSARRVLLVVLDPRPRWWASSWLWGIGAIFAVAIGSPGRPHETVSSSGALTAYRTASGFQLEDAVSGPTGQKLVLSMRFRIVEGADYLRLDAPWPTLISATPTSPLPTPSELQEIAVMFGSRWSGTIGNVGDAAPVRGIKLWARGQTCEVKRGWVSWVYEIASWLGLTVLGIVAIVAFLRAAQTKWHTQQIASLEKKQCPRCLYDLSATPAGLCPECGCDSRVARREAEDALGPKSGKDLSEP